MINLILFGPPYSGKGTQGALLAKKYDLMHISTGDMLRIEAEKKSELGLIAKSYTDQGLFAPNDLVMQIMEKIITENMNNVKGFLFDGFPRMIIQAHSFDVLCDKVGLNINGVIGLHVPESELTIRAVERAKNSNRDDDKNPEMIAKRLAVHNEKAAPLEDFYRNRNIYFEINGIGTTSEVLERISQSIDTLK